MKTTVLYDDRTTVVAAAEVDGEHLWLKPDDFHEATGWKLESAGLCRGDACVRTDPIWVDDAGRLNLTAFAQHMGQPMVREAEHNAWAFGESVSTRRYQLFSLEAPDFTLPDIDGNLHSLSDYRGKKVFMYSWGSY